MNERRQIGQVLVSLIVVAGFVSVLLLLILRPINLTDNMFNLLLVLTGSLAAKFCDVVQYYIGSSAGSREKDQTLKAIATGTTVSADEPPKPPTGG